MPRIEDEAEAAVAGREPWLGCSLRGLGAGSSALLGAEKLSPSGPRGSSTASNLVF